MKNRFLLIIFITLIIISCSASLENAILGHKIYLKENEASGYIIPETNEYNNTKFWIVSIDEIKRARSLRTLTYLGSDLQYHYFKTWNKIVKKGEITFFALYHIGCEIPTHRTIDEEINYIPKGLNFHPWIKVKIHKDKSIVESDITQDTWNQRTNSSIVNLDISNYLPEKLKFCDNEIDSSHFAYKELEAWFKNNTTEWKRSFVSFAVGTLYESEEIYINVLENAVVVYFKVNDPVGEQIVHTKDPNILTHKCEKLK